MQGPARCFEINTASCRLARCGHLLACSSGEQLSSLVDGFETQDREDKALTQNLSAVMIEDDSREETPEGHFTAR